MNRRGIIPILLALSLTFIFFEVNAQTYGNEWLKKDIIYYKIAVAQNGISKITGQELIASFNEISGVDPAFLHLHHFGQEIPIYLINNSLPTFDPTDELYFYVEKNAGILDKSLYSSSSAQAHNHYSFYTDTAYYFLSVDNSAQGIRFQKTNETNINATPELSFNYESFQFYTENYATGRGYAGKGNLSEYTIGEGYVSNQLGLGQTQTRNISTPFAVNSNNIANAEIYIVGRSDALANNINLNHHVRVEFSGSNNFTTKIDTSFGNYQTLRIGFNLLQSELANNNQFKISSINDLGALSDFTSIAYFKINYLRKFELDNNKSLKFEFQNSINNQKSSVTFNGNNTDSLVLFDLNNHTYTLPILQADSSQFLIPFFNQKRSFYIQPFKESSFIKALKIEKVNTQKTDLNSSNETFIIISHLKLKPSAENYLAYRQSKGVNSKLVYTDDLYNEFTYGQHHPLAIKRYIDFLSSQNNSKPSQILLLGKGQQSNTTRNLDAYKRDLVPSIGTPASDFLFVSSLDFSKISSEQGIGRIAAETNEEVMIYLNKLMEYEANNSDSLWRKNIVHITGGRSTGENDLFISSLKECELIAQSTSLGAQVINYNKKVNEPVTNSFKEQIVKNIHDGVGLISYFGHGANYVVEVNFGETEDLHNKGKYPIYFLNGCSVANPNFDNSMGENFIFASQKGAIAWFGSVDLGYPSYLGEFDKAFYQRAFKIDYGSTLGDIIKNSIKDFQNTNDTLNLIHARQFCLQGDPLIHFYSPSLPDYNIKSNNIYIDAANNNETNDTVNINIIVENLGKAITDSLGIRISQTLEDQSIIQHPIKYYQSVFRNDTLVYTINNPNQRSKGLNKLNVQLDPENKISENSKSNNQITIDHLFPSNALYVLSPSEFAMVNDIVVSLHVQSSNFHLKNVNYLFEIDTSINFNSAFLKTFQKTSNNNCILKINFPLNNLTTYYWRVKTNNAGILSDWTVSSFTYSINNSISWSQNHYQQLNRNQFNNLLIDSTSKLLDFVTNGIEITIKTRGDLARIDSIERRIRFNNNPPVYPPGNPQGIGLIAIDPVSLDRFSKASAYNYAANTPDYPFEIYKYSGVYFFDLSNANALDTLKEYLNSIPNGFVVAGYNGMNSNFKTLPESVLLAFEQLGLSKVRTIENGDPYAFVGFKGASIGSAIEKVADPNSVEASNKQFIRIDYFHSGKWNNGNMTSSIIGPVANWSKVKVDLTKEIADKSNLKVIGIRTDQSKQILVNTSQTDSVDISFIDATIYPKIQLQLILSDSVNRTAAQFNDWSVNYKALPEFTFDPNIAFEFYANSIKEGDSVRLKLGYTNSSNTKLDSFKMVYKLIKSDRSVQILSTELLGNLKHSDSLILNKKISTRFLTKKNQLLLEASAINQNENYLFNNSIYLPFDIINDTRPPLLNVSIDGRTPINKEIVSPTPTILISSKDDNSILLLNDTSLFQIELRKPNETQFEKISMNQNEIQFIAANSGSNNVAKVIYQPKFTESGMYTLRIKAKDASGNAVNNSAYEIDLEVITESSISNFYPYPNPFTTSTQFVFTLTGNQLPDDLKIQIMTVSGKVVKEITKAELGNIHVGNNITDYKWNGCDEFGDRLATGVYFYRVLMKNSFDMKKRETSADKYFEKGFGKLYLIN